MSFRNCFLAGLLCRRLRNSVLSGHQQNT